jgi:spore germination protein GerM
VRRHALVASVLATGLLLAGCGIPLSTSAHLMSKSALPEALAQPAGRALDNGQAQAAHGYKPIDVFLVDIAAGALVPRQRNVKPPVTGQAVLDALEAGPFTTDYQSGIGSALATESHLVFLRLDHGIATVRLDSYFVSLHGEAPVEELGQVVWTLTRAPLHITKVQFVGPTRPLAVETYTGAFVHRPVGPCDYQLGRAC